MVSENKISCDYLVVGAGTACLSFLDTVLALRKEATFVLVDRLSAPGGHWTKAYPYVRLHQPSCYYGVNSLPLSKLNKKGNEPFDQSVRASAKEICEYYQKVVDNFVASGRVTTYFEANYEGEATNEDGSSRNSFSNSYKDPTAKITHTIKDKDGRTIFVDCTKVVRCESNVQVPSMRDGPPFPIDKSVQCIAPNDLVTRVGSESSYENFLVVGGGKTGTDAIIYLLRNKKIRQDQITWIVPRPSWYFVSDWLQRSNKPGRYFWQDAVRNIIKPFIAANNAKEAFLNMEKLGVTQRVDIDDEIFPMIFKGATINQSEMDDLRTISNVVKNKGRVTSITTNEVVFADGTHSIPFSPANSLVIDCTVEDTYGYLDFKEDFRFFNPHRIRLGPLTSMFNPSHTSAQIGFVESEYSDTASGDEVKNSYLFFARGEAELRDKDLLAAFILSFYIHQKTDFEFDKCPTYRNWVLGQRTDRNQPGHHGGVMGLLWAVFGPTKLAKYANAFRTKMETGGFEDFPTNPLPGRPGADPSKHTPNLRYPPKPKKKNKLHRLAMRQKHTTKPCVAPENTEPHHTAKTIELVH